MATYLLVHGACWAGVCWNQVAALLQGQRHTVFTPTLTGLGERAHLASPAIDLDTHIADIVGVLEYYDLRQVVLVGHSYGGMVVTGAADHCSDRVAQLVFVDGHAPKDGESVKDMQLDSSDWDPWIESMRTEGDGWRIPREPDWSPFMRPHPLKTFTQPIALKNEKVTAMLPRTFVFCTAPRHPAIIRSAERARSQGWRYYELPTGHMAMLTMPKELADILLELA